MNGFDDTIYALSSGAPPSAIAVVRVSGACAERVTREFCGTLPAARRASLRTLRSNGGVLDHALVLWFPGPNTATGEDLVEFHLHGGRALIDAVLRALAELGLRMAEPGEFTRRALLNGRLSLGEAEGLVDLLHAETESQRVEALRRSEGALGRMLAGWSDRLVDISAQLEAAIDYDEDLSPTPAYWRPAVAALADDMRAALAVPPAERLREGVRIAIVGPVNAGKSTLFNALVGSDAAIVTDIPGTTRDAVERSVALAGRPVMLIDTAGIRTTSDVVEQIGIERAHRSARSADIILDLQGEAGPTTIAVAAKADVSLPRAGALPLSAHTGEGMAALRSVLLERIDALLPRPGTVCMDRRYREKLGEVLEHLQQGACENDLLFCAERVRRARTAIDGLTGNAGLEDVWDMLFSRLCLGK